MEKDEKLKTARLIQGFVGGKVAIENFLEGLSDFFELEGKKEIPELAKIWKGYEAYQNTVADWIEKLNPNAADKENMQKLYHIIQENPLAGEGKEVQAAAFVELLSALDSKVVAGESVQPSEKGKSTGKKESRKATGEDRIYQCVVEGSKTEIVELLKPAIEKYEAQEILNKWMIPGITHVGDLYDKKVYFLPQLLLSAETMKAGMAFLDPYLKEGASEKKGKIILATVKGDIHDIGKNIVGIILENYGFDVVDLGKDIAKEVILEEAIKQKADIIALSALMTTTMVEMKHFVDYMKEQGKNLPVMIGGAVVNADYADEIGAYYSADAVGAVELANQLIAERTK